MKDSIHFNRHKKKYNKYLKEIINQPEIVKVINLENIKEIKDDESLNIDCLVIGKRIFPFFLSYKGKYVGLFCLDNINWESKNCRLKGGIFENYIDLINKEQLKECFKYILSFSNDNLGIKRVSGVIRRNSFAFEEVNEIFDKEGENINKTIAYYANVVEENLKNIGG